MKLIYFIISLTFILSNNLLAKSNYEFIGCKNIDISFPTYLKERRQCNIVINDNISKKQLRKAFVETVKKVSKENPNLDEISVHAWFNKNSIGINKSVSSVDWAPNGIWGSSNKSICESNNRENYLYKFYIDKRIGEKLDKKPTQKEREIYAETMKELYANENLPENIILKRIGKRYNMSASKIKKILNKVMNYDYQY